MTRKQWFFRVLLYAVSIVIQALGITLNTKTGLGVSPLASVAYSVTELTGVNIGNTTFIYYVLITVLQLIIPGRDRSWWVLLQIPFSVVFTRFMNLYDVGFDLHPQFIWQRLLILFIAIVLTSVGAAMNVNARFVANPCDGFTNLLGDRTGRGMGFVKNIFDIVSVGTAFLIDLFGHNLFAGIGIGTVISVILIGRVIALYNHFFKKVTMELSGLGEYVNVPSAKVANGQAKSMGENDK